MSDQAGRRREVLVQETYSAAARDPGGAHLFEVGRELALGVGYPRELLDRMPETAVDAFAGVAAVSVNASVRPGERVLDLGCGAGLDSLVAAERGCRVVGIDFSADLLARRRRPVPEASAGAGRRPARCR
jgi:arsenite methyltransferase